MTPEQKARRLERLRWRYHNDPAYRERVLEQQRALRQRPDQKVKARERARRWAASNKEHLRAKRAEWYATEMEKPANREAASRRARASKLRAYGLTPADYDAMEAAQSGACLICGGDNGPIRLHVDHDHATGLIRGLLCGPCNQGLGSFRDSPDLLRAAADYIAARRIAQEAA